MNTGTGAKCTILLKRSTTTKMPVQPCVSAGRRKTKSMLTDHHVSMVMGSGRRGAATMELASHAGNHHTSKPACGPTCTCGASRCHERARERSSHAQGGRHLDCRGTREEAVIGDRRLRARRCEERRSGRCCTSTGRHLTNIDQCELGSAL